MDYIVVGGISMPHKPLIGITPGYDYDKNMLFAKNGYYNAICESGGIPVILPVIQEQSILEELTERLDGFLLCGGPDLDARCFGEYNLPYTDEISPYRDGLEIYVSKRAVELVKPIFGICRGIQVLNAALGGTIYQDIYAQVPERQLIRHSQKAPVWYPTHKACIEKDSRLLGFLGKGCLDVNSFHHQAVRDVAPRFHVAACAEDGMIEAIEHDNHPFVVGVQWHPELMWQKDRSFLRLFEELVKACG
jgi:putative glutamine amidotransferase